MDFRYLWHKAKRPLLYTLIFLLIGLFCFGTNFKLQKTSAALSDWYSLNWKYRKPITVDNSGSASSLTNYQLKVTLNNTNFDFSKAKTDGSDLRFADSDGLTLISYWIESYDAVGETAVIWVKVPSIPALSSKTIYIYHDNSSASSSSNGDNTFAFYDGFENTFGVAPLTNAPSYQTTPTYDSSGQGMHPDVVYFPSAWNSYKYWMAMTPYPGGNDDFENPSVLASNDGSSWEVPAGLTNPLIGMPPCDHNNDADMIYNSATNELWLYYLDTRRAGYCAGHEAQPYYNHNYLKLFKSSDGVNWAGPTTVIDWNLGTTPLLLSPSVVRLTDTSYRLWVTDGTTTMRIYSSSDGENWPSFQTITAPDNIWHFNVNYISEKAEYWLTSIYSSTASSLRFLKSTNGTNWTTYSTDALLPSPSGWDTTPYRATLLYDNSTNLIKVWYSGSTALGVWHTGYTEKDYTDFYNKISSSSWARTGDGLWSNSAGQIKRGAYSGKLVQQAKFDTRLSQARSFPSEYYQEWDMYDDLDASALKMIKTASPSDETVGIGVWTGASAGKYVYVDKAGAYTATAIDRAAGWHKFGLLLKFDKSITFYIDGVNAGSLAGQFNYGSQVFMNSFKNNTTTYYADDIRVRQYTSPEPSATLGVQEVIAGVLVNLSSPAADTIFNTTTPTFSWSSNVAGRTDFNYQLFIDSVLNKSVNSAIFSTTVDGPLSEGAHSWFIRAVNVNGEILAQSGSWNFSIEGAVSGGDFQVSGRALALNTNFYLNFTDNNANVTVSNISHKFSGYAWSDDLGWIAFGDTNNPNGAVVYNENSGAVTGKARVLNDSTDLVFNAAPYNSNVVISDSGVFSGYAWSIALGWINFSEANAPGFTHNPPAPSAPVAPVSPPAPVPLTEVADTTAPSLSISYPPYSNWWTYGYQIPIRATAVDANGDLDRVWIYNQQTEETVDVEKINDDGYFEQWFDLERNSKNIVQVKAQDKDGNLTTKELNIYQISLLFGKYVNLEEAKIELEKLGTQAVVFTAISDDVLGKEIDLTKTKELIFYTQYPKFIGITISEGKVDLYINSDQEIQAVTMANSEGDWQYQLTEPLDYGQHTIYATVTDKDDNISQPSEKIAFTIKSESEMPLASKIEKNLREFQVWWIFAGLAVLIALIFTMVYLRKQKRNYR